MLQDVARLKSEGQYGKKEYVVVTPNLARATPKETLLAMREELEAERKRRMEQMNSEDHDEDSRMTSLAKKGVNEELLHLFAFHDVSKTGSFFYTNLVGKNDENNLRYGKMYVEQLGQVLYHLDRTYTYIRPNKTESTNTQVIDTRIILVW